MNTQDDIIVKLKKNYALFAYGWANKPDYVEIIEDTYRLLLELKEINLPLAHKQAQELIQIANTANITSEYEMAYIKWLEMLPLFKKI